MKAIQLLQASNTISRYDQRVHQELVFVMLVENIGFDKVIAQVAVYVFKLRKAGGGPRG